MNEVRDLICQHCGDRFKRSDHLSRHELSHGEAKYRCQVTTCGMAFHRRDVLKRHEAVHQSGSMKKRRRPRRGALPSVRSTTTSSDVSRSQNNSRTNPASTSKDFSCSQVPVPNAIIFAPSSALSPLDFCFLHYVQMCAERWPFIHHSHLQQAQLTKEKQLAIAALGGCVVPEYRSVAAAFFADAQKLLLEAHAANAISAIANQLQCSDSPNIAVLELVQTHMLLLEYALWHAGSDSALDVKRWATDIIIEYASVIIPALIVHIQKIQRQQQDWQEWIYEEQLIRASWTFYCVTQKAMTNLPYSVSTLRSQQHLPLPRSDILFTASDKQHWHECYDESSVQGVGHKYITLKAALEDIQSFTLADRQILTSLTPMDQHIILVALLEVHNSGIKYLAPKVDNEGGQDVFIDLIRHAKFLWHNSPGDLLFSSPPRSLDLQNVLLMNYLHIRGLLHCANRQDGTRFWPNLYTAASVANEVLTPVLEKGAFDVVTKAAWLTDSASKRYVVKMAQVMVEWADTLKSKSSEAAYPENTNSDVLYNQLNGFFQQQEDDGMRDRRSDGGPARFASDLRDAWSNILLCPPAKWYHQRIS